MITFYGKDYGKKDYPWRFSAKNGESRNNGELILLMGDVRLWQMQDNVVTNELTTDSLTLRPGEALAQTDEAIIAKSAVGTMKATGATLFIDDGKIEFLSAVRGVYGRP